MGLFNHGGTGKHGEANPFYTVAQGFAVGTEAIRIGILMVIL